MRKLLLRAALTGFAGTLLVTEAAAESLARGAWMCRTEQAALLMLAASSAGDLQRIVRLTDHRRQCLFVASDRSVTVILAGPEVSKVGIASPHGPPEEVWVAARSIAP